MRPAKLSVATLALVLVASLLTAPPVTAEPREQTRVTGTVTFRGEPVADSVVSLRSRQTTRHARTDAEGRFTKKVPPGSYWVSARSARHGTHRTFSDGTLRRIEAARTKARTGRTTRVTIALAPAATITGRVVDAQGRPAAGVRLHAENTDRHGITPVTKTDRKGRYVFKGLSRGKVHVTVVWGANFDAQGHTTVRVRHGRTARAPDIRLGAPPHGWVTAEVAPGTAAVAVHRKTGDRIPLERDPAGTRWSARVPPGKWLVTLPGTNSTSATLRVRDGATVHAGRLTAPTEHGTLTGQVLRSDGEPARSGRIEVVDALGFRSGSARVLRDGTFTVPELAPGTHWVRGPGGRADWGVGAPPQEVHVRAGETTTTTRRFITGHTVRGVVVHRGAGVRKIMVRLVRDGTMDVVPYVTWVRTTKRGRFEITGAQPGTYTLQVRDSSPVYRFRTMRIEVVDDVTTVRVTLKK